MSNGREGGIWALAGYLYQIVGMLSISARVSSLALKANTTDDVLVNLYDVGGLFMQAEHEAAEDALLRFRSLKLNENDDCVLLQFKYSMTDRPIGGPELKGIIKSLDESVKKVSRDGQNVTACVLITNRRFTRGRSNRAEEVWEAARTEVQDYELRRVPDYSMERFISELKGFGKEYGAFREEVERGIRDLIGGVILGTGRFPHCASVDKKDLIEAFTGCRQAQPLITDVIREQSRKDIERLGETVVIEQWNREPVEREVYEDVIQAINEQRALIHLHGPGGCGKSILMWQLLDQLPPKRCCTVIHAEQVLRIWVEGTVHSWRNLPGNTEDTADMALQRLMIANPTSPKPIVWLALDGLDEGHLSPDCKSNIREVLRWFWNRDRNRTNDPPLATLIVTCREESDLRNWLQLHPFSSRELPPSIHVGNFSEREFKKALDRKFPGLHDRIQQRFGIQPEAFWDDYDTSVFGSSLPSDRFDSLDERVLESLKHPAMWLAILRLDCKTQIRAIKGEPQAVQALARRFIEWFGYKLGRRKQQLHDLLDNGCDDLVEILKVIAQHSSGAAANTRDEGWIEPARRTPHRLSGREAEILYDEAVSAGLVEEDSRRVWRWRHSIVYDYLLSSTQEG